MTKEEEKEYNKKYYQANRERILAQQAEYYKANKGKIAVQQAEYYHANKEKKLEYYNANKEKVLERQAEYNATQIGRAKYLIGGYRRKDKKYNRGECTLTAQWLVDNIFNKPCRYCGESDWRKIGCDRIDNSKPHTIDNVVPCCSECNKKRGTMEYNEFKELVRNETENPNICI